MAIEPTQKQPPITQDTTPSTPEANAGSPAKATKKPVKPRTLLDREVVKQAAQGKFTGKGDVQLFGLAYRAGADEALVRGLFTGKIDLATTEGPRTKYRWQHEELSRLRKEIRSALTTLEDKTTGAAHRLLRAEAKLTAEIDARKTGTGFKRFTDHEKYSENYVSPTSLTGMAHGIRKHILKPMDTGLMLYGSHIDAAAHAAASGVAKAADVVTRPIRDLCYGCFLGVKAGLLGVKWAAQQAVEQLHSFFTSEVTLIGGKWSVTSGKAARERDQRTLLARSETLRRHTEVDQAATIARIDDKPVNSLTREYVAQRIAELMREFGKSDWQEARPLFMVRAASAENTPARLERQSDALKVAAFAHKVAAGKERRVRAKAAEFARKIRTQVKQKQDVRLVVDAADEKVSVEIRPRHPEVGDSASGGDGQATNGRTRVRTPPAPAGGEGSSNA